MIKKFIRLLKANQFRAIEHEYDYDYFKFWLNSRAFLSIPETWRKRYEWGIFELTQQFVNCLETNCWCKKLSGTSYEAFPTYLLVFKLEYKCRLYKMNCTPILWNSYVFTFWRKSFPMISQNLKENIFFPYQWIYIIQTANTNNCLTLKIYGIKPVSDWV